VGTWDNFIGKWEQKLGFLRTTSDLMNAQCNQKYIFHVGVYFFFKYGQLHVGEKNDLKGMKKGGEMHIFPPIGKKFAYFFPN